MLWTTLAAAHVGATITGVDLEPHVDGTLLEANFGMVWAQGEGPWRWSCHEVVTQPESVITPRYARSSEGTLLVTITAMQGRDSRHSLYRSDDGGCNWVEAGLEDRVVSALDWSGELALAGTGDAEDNALFSSPDGAVWTRELELGDFVVASVLPGHATALQPQTEQALLLERTDAGWTTSPFDLSPYAAGHLQRFLVLAGHEGVRWLVAGFYEKDLLLRVDEGGVEVVLEVEGDLIDGGRTDAGELWVVEGSRRVWSSPDGRAFAPVDGAAVSIGIATGEEVWLTGYAEYIGALVLKAPYQVVLRPYELAGPLECPAGSQHSQVCEPLWEDLDARLQVFAPSGDSGWDSDGPDSQPTAEEPDTPCGCATGPSPWWLGLLALLIRR